MHHKNIKRMVRKQLKNEYPNWKRLTKKVKKDLAGKVLTEVVAEYDFKQDIEVPLEELLAIETQLPAKGIIPLDEMARFIDMVNCDKIIKLSNDQRSSSYIKDSELQFIDALIDDGAINRLLSYDGYSPAMRDIFPSNLFRAEFLKAIKYPEISYRKFCTEEYTGLDRKQNRVFMGLPLHKKVMIDHTQLCKFRSSLSFVQQVNLLVYILHFFKQSGRLGDSHLHGIDSTELANDCKMPLASVEINGKKIRIYNDIDCDCGARRNKRNKSKYVVGYRLHTLTAIDAKTGHSFPLVSLLSPANHHDSHFLSFLVKLAQAMGIDVKLITADEAYHDKDGSLFEETGVIVTTPPSKNVSLPENIDGDRGTVFCNDSCAIAMRHVGFENQTHEYKCGVTVGECFRSSTCSQYRFFLPIMGSSNGFPGKRNKYSWQMTVARTVNAPLIFSRIKPAWKLFECEASMPPWPDAHSAVGVLLIEMAGSRRKKKANKPQQLSLLDSKAA